VDEDELSCWARTCSCLLMEFSFWAGRKLHLHTAHERHMCIPADTYHFTCPGPHSENSMPMFWQTAAAAAYSAFSISASSRCRMQKRSGVYNSDGWMAGWDGSDGWGTQRPEDGRLASPRSSFSRALWEAHMCAPHAGDRSHRLIRTGWQNRICGRCTRTAAEQLNKHISLGRWYLIKN